MKVNVFQGFAPRKSSRLVVMPSVARETFDARKHHIFAWRYANPMEARAMELARNTALSEIRRKKSTKEQIRLALRRMQADGRLPPADLCDVIGG